MIEISLFGWRWWDISKSGSLMSVNGVLWEPDEVLKAECAPAGAHGANRLAFPAGHDKLAILPDGRTREVPLSTKLGKRKNGLEVVREGVPGTRCHCGFWAYYDPEGASGLPRAYGHGYLRYTKVFGVIEAWGGIMHHELGFRCEYATVRGVFVQRGRLHPAYNIPRYRSFDAIIAAWDVDPIEDDDEATINQLLAEIEEEQ